MCTYALNYKGEVRLNGESFYEIKGEKDMNYNYSSYADFKEGRNVFEVDYTALSEPWKTEIEIKVYDDKDNTLADWKVDDTGGRKTFELSVD